MTSSRKEYPQAELSRNLIANALLELLKTKPYSKISIAELTECADIARRTFYRHFESINDVLLYVLSKIATEFSNTFWNSYDCTLKIHGVMKLYFTYWKNHIDFLKILQKNNMLFVVLETIMPQIRSNIRDQIPKLKKVNLSDNEIFTRKVDYNEVERLEYIFYFMSGGAFNLLAKWIENGTELSANEMANIAVDAIDFFSGKGDLQKD